MFMTFSNNTISVQKLTKICVHLQWRNIFAICTFHNLNILVHNTVQVSKFRIDGTFEMKTGYNSESFIQLIIFSFKADHFVSKVEAGEEH